MTEASELVSVSLHNMSPFLLREFAVKVVAPYFGGNFNEAIRQLMDKALIEEELLQANLDKRRL